MLYVRPHMCNLNLCFVAVLGSGSGGIFGTYTNLFLFVVFLGGSGSGGIFGWYIMEGKYWVGKWSVDWNDLYILQKCLA